MGAISVDTYIQIAGNYGNALYSVQNVYEDYYAAAYQIVILTVFDPEIDLLVPFYNAYLTALTVVAQPPSSAVTAINRLQQHVLDKARYDTIPASNPSVYSKFTDINDWLTAKVSGDSVTRYRAVPSDTDPGTETNQNDIRTEVEGDPSFGVNAWTYFKVLSASAGYTIDT